MNIEYIVNIKIKHILDRSVLRNAELKQCKTEEQRERLKERWVIEDSAEKIADAVATAAIMNNRRGLFGIF